jgi:hypothetical protein
MGWYFKQWFFPSLTDTSNPELVEAFLIARSTLRLGVRARLDICQMAHIKLVLTCQGTIAETPQFSGLLAGLVLAKARFDIRHT